MTPSAPIDGCTRPPAHGSKPFSAIRKLRVSPRVVARFVGGSLLSLKSHTAPRSTPDLATALQQSCIAWKKNMLYVEDLRTHLGQLPLPPGSPSPMNRGDQERLPQALLVYDEASATARGDYASFLQASHNFAQGYVDAVLERMRFQSGTLEVLLGLLEMARRLRGEATRLKISFKRGPCRQFKCIVKESNSKPLLFDTDIFDGIAVSLRDIQAAYKLLEDFWAIEMHSLNQAIDTVHVDRVRVERWLGYKGTLEEVILKWKGVRALTNDGIEDVEVDSDHELEPTTGSDLTAIARQLCPHMITAGSLLHTMRDHAPSADMPPIQIAIFGLQQSQQQLLSFFNECVKYWEKFEMRSEVSAGRPTLEKLATSQKLLAENLDQAPDNAQVAIHSIRNAIARDECSDKPREQTHAVAGSGLHSGPDRGGIGDVMSRSCHLEDIGYDPFNGMTLEELGKERQKWTACRKFFENELRANHCLSAKMS